MHEVGAAGCKGLSPQHACHLPQRHLGGLACGNTEGVAVFGKLCHDVHHVLTWIDQVLPLRLHKDMLCLVSRGCQRFQGMPQGHWCG